MRTILIAMGVLFIAAAHVRAQEVHCLDTDTPRECIARLQAEREAALRATVAAINTGAATGASPTRTALKDFLSVAAAHLNGSFLDDRGNALALTYNLPLPIARQHVQIETVFTTPQISNAAAAAAGTSATPLISTFSNADDVQSTLSFASSTRRFGPFTAPHRELYATLLVPLLTSGAVPGGIEPASFDVPFRELAPDAATRAATIAAFETAARTSLPPAAEKLTKDFAALLSAQPHLYASGVVHYRDPLVGPRVWEGRVTWELGAHNLNGFHARDGRDCASERACLEAFQRYVQRTPNPLSRGRLALSLGYSSVLASTPPVATPFVTPAAAGFVYTAAYGLPFASFLPGREGRLDFTMTYDGKKVRRNVVTAGAASSVALAEVLSEPQSVAPPLDRFVIAGTYTQKLSDRVAMQVSLVGSERSETLPGTCDVTDLSPPVFVCTPAITTTRRPLVAHLGLTYRIPPRVPGGGPKPPCCCCGE